MNYQTQIKEARKRHNRAVFIGTIKAYCQEPACNAREVEILLKEHEGLTGQHPACPYCKQDLKIHKVLSAREQAESVRLFVEDYMDLLVNS